MFIAVLLAWVGYLAFKWWFLLWDTAKHGGPIYRNQAIWEGRAVKEVLRDRRENLVCLVIGILFALWGLSQG